MADDNVTDLDDKRTTKKATKKGAKKAPPAAKKATDRRVSTVSKEGTQKDEFTGEELPVTAFPTVRRKDPETGGHYYVRGTVARKNLAAWREEKRKARAAEGGGTATKKATAKKGTKRTAKKATKKAATKGGSKGGSKGDDGSRAARPVPKPSAKKGSKST